MQICSVCGKSKPLSDFYRQSNGRGPMRHCKACFAITAKVWYQAHKGEVNRRVVVASRARRLGLTYDQYLAKGEPSPTCEICGVTAGDPRNGMHRSGSSPEAKPKRLSIDHDHSTGQRRGMLCGHCNRAIGLAGDDPARLRKMARYIEKHRRLAIV